MSNGFPQFMTTRNMYPGGAFDYGDYEAYTKTPYSIKNVVYFSVVSALFILGIVGTLVVLLLLLVKKGKHFRGVRWYAFNMMLCNLLYLVRLICISRNLWQNGVRHFLRITVSWKLFTGVCNLQQRSVPFCWYGNECRSNELQNLSPTGKAMVLRSLLLHHGYPLYRDYHSVIVYFYKL